MKKQKIFFLLVLLFSLGACSKEYLNVNTDPNNPSTVTPDLVIPGATASLAGVVGGDYAILGGFWSQYWTQCAGANQYKNIDGYELLTSFDNGDWSEIYSGAFNNFAYIKKQALISNLNAYNYMATVLESYGYQVMVDLYDQIPFNNALQGTSNNFQPTWDLGATVYDSIAIRLERLSSLNISVPLSSSQINQDYLFGASQNSANPSYILEMANWQAFANTLLLKIYLRQMYARPDTCANGIARLVKRMQANGGKFLTTTAGMGGFTNNLGKANPLYDINVLSSNFANNLRSSTTLFNYLKSNNDLRLPTVCGPGPNANATGYIPEIQGGVNVQYFGEAAVLANTSIAVSNATDTVYFMSVPESYFLQAEAVAAGYIPASLNGTDSVLFYEGISNSYGKNGLTYVSGTYSYPTNGTFEQKQSAIIMQKWVAMANGQGLEAFFETNRTGYPTAYPLILNQNNVVDTTLSTWGGGQLIYSLIGATTNHLFPKRLLFPDIEIETNPHTPTVVPITTKVWWDTKPSK